jgi:alpha-L-rhamnosidase
MKEYSFWTPTQELLLRKSCKALVWILLILGCCAGGRAQEPEIQPALLHGSWPASWISCPGIAQRAYGVYHFRKHFTLAAVPQHFIVHLSGDNRYRFFVNGKAVCSGPARSDLAHWNFETVDISPYLQTGENVVAAIVWNMGEYAAVAQISNQTGFLVQGNDAGSEVLNTDRSWKVLQDSAYRPCSTNAGNALHAYYVIGPGDEVDGARYPWGWEQAAYDDKGWRQAVGIAHPEPIGYGSDNLWTMVPRTIPLMEETMQRIATVRRGTFDGSFIHGQHPVTIPAHDSVVILLDQSHNTVAYPQLVVSRGKGSRVRLTYAEALFDAKGQKGNRNSIEGKTIIGDYDIFKPDGGRWRSFRPLWMRTFRYLQVQVVTGQEPLVIEDLYGMYTGYPFERRASFSSNDSSLRQLWDVGWRTARLCAGETYFDCPYYEQLQYEADTRIQALISLYITGDDRLMRKAITDFYNSRVAEGLTQGRYPSSRLQVIPPFSLFWISMLYDYWMHRRDDAFIREKLFAVRGVLDWFEQRIDTEKGMLGPLSWWNFVDWNTQFPGGVPDGAVDGNSSVVSLQFAYTLQQAAALFGYFKDQAVAEHYLQLADTLTRETYRRCFDPVRGEMANTPRRGKYSQHASIMGVLTGSVPAAEAKSVMEHVLEDTSLSQCTFYYRFYLTQALKKAGMAELYYSSLKPWRDMIANGLTTFAENPDPTRSDCHAWSASPIYDFLSTLCGINPASPGFDRVSIRPALGELKEVRGAMPHPKGMITVHLIRQGAEGIKGEIELPRGVSGIFYWKGEEVPLHEGKQEVVAGAGMEGGDAAYRTIRFYSSHNCFPDTGRVDGHRDGDGIAQPKAGHYDDSTVLLVVPKGYRPEKTVDLVFWFHGWHNNVDTALRYYGLADQFAASKRQAVMVLPEAARNAADSYGGKMGQEGMFRLLVADVMQELREKGIVPRGAVPEHVALAGHSGAYLVIADILDKGRQPVDEVFLFDALYGHVDTFLPWAVEEKHHFVHWFTNTGYGPDKMSDTMMLRLKGIGVSYKLVEEGALTPEIIRSTRILFIHSPRQHNDIINRPDDWQLLLEDQYR